MKRLLLFAFSIVFLNVAAQAQTIKIVNPPPNLVNFLYKTDDGKENLQKNYQGNLSAAVRDLQVRAADIDRDGGMEYFVSQKSLCKNADCAVTLYKRKGAAFAALLTAPRLDISAGRSEGRRNLISCEPNAAQPRCSFLRWYKTEYVKYRCVEAESSKSSVKSKEVPCGDK